MNEGHTDGIRIILKTKRLFVIPINARKYRVFIGMDELKNFRNFCCKTNCLI